MSVPTLLEVLEEESVRHANVRIIIGGALLPAWTSLEYSFSFGQVPTAIINVPGRDKLPAAVAEEASVQIWFGYRHGMSILEELVFGGGVVDSVGSDGHNVLIECVMSGPRKLSYSYNRRINYEFEAVTAEEAIVDLLTLAGVSNYAVNVVPWVLGTAVPQTIQFSTYGEAINKISEVDGSPWYCMPSGQVRVETRDPIPSPSYRRTYFSNILTGPFSTAPVEITNENALPLINDIQRRKFRDEVANFIEVDGAILITLGPNGEQNSEQIIEQVDGLSGQFPNGAFWIPTPPLFQDFTFQNELIDTNAKAFEVAERYFELKNRLVERIPLSIPGDPDVFLGETVRVIDKYSGVSSLYFVEGYRTSITESTCNTELDLSGGPESGTVGFAAPFAEFIWKYQQIHNIIPGYWDNIKWTNLGYGSDLGAELCIDLPAGTGSTPQGGNLVPGQDRRSVLIGLDAGPSKDFDGEITSYEWSYVDASMVTRNLTGKRVLLAFNPDVTTTVDITLTVTDNSGRTDSITKTVYTHADYLVPSIPDYPDETLNDTPQGGGVVIGPCSEPDPGATYPPEGAPVPPTGGSNPGACEGMQYAIMVAADEYIMASVDNRIWHDLSREDAEAVGKFISVAGGFNISTQRGYGLFGTDAGEIFLTQDMAESVIKVLEIEDASRVEVILFDNTAMGVPAQGNRTGDEGGPDQDFDIPIYTQANPGTMTIRQAYEQALAVGFSPSAAIIAVAILIAESSLVSNATNSVGNVPPSTDRGIAQINSYYHPEVSDACAFNTECAIRAMYNIANGGTDFTPWVAYTAGTFRRHLSTIHDALGMEGPPGDDEEGYNNTVPRSLKVWAGTSTGKIYLSEDSGRNWTLFSDLRALFPGPEWKINALITDSRISYPFEGIPKLAIFGGDTGVPDSLINVVASIEGGVEPLRIGGQLLEHVTSLGAGYTIKGACLNQTALLIILSDDTVWITLDVFDPEAWYQATGTAGPYGFSDINECAPGFDGEFLLAGDIGVWRTEDNENFELVGSTSEPIQHMLWTGIQGMYVAAAD